MNRRFFFAGLTVTLALISAIFLLKASASGIRQSKAVSAPSAPAATFTVTTTADGGAGSLRDAITQANASAGADLIDFNLGTGTPTIKLGSSGFGPLPAITQAVTIDGATGGATRIELDGTLTGAAADGLTITSGNCTIRALVINRFSGNGVSISGGGLNTLENNFIGTDATGTAMSSNALAGVLISGSPNHTIGGTTAATRNIISGNGGTGVQIQNAGSSNIHVTGNFIGADVTGALPITNASGGVLVLPGPSEVTIGGTVSGEGNLISGNGAFGVHMEGDSHIIAGNLIGTTLDGLAALPNGNGIEMSNVSLCLIGGTDGRNIISGNDSIGVVITNNSSAIQVQGNFIGTDISGAAALGNASAGVLIDLSSFNNTIGGTNAGDGNVISANAGAGIVISGANANAVQGNFIGTDVNGVNNLGNASSGVAIGSSTLNNTIGGITAGAGNTIAFNGLNGITIVGGTQNAVLSNSISSNTGVGIDLSDDGGVTPNDSCDGDTGANDLQNFPVLTSAISMGASTTIVGSLNSTASTLFRIEFFSNTTCDASGNGEGAFLIGSTDVTTDPTCLAPININLPVGVPPGNVITATATDPQGNTSEFSQCEVVAGTDAELVIGSNIDSPDPVVAGTNITYTIAFGNNGPADAQNVTVTNAVPANTTFVSATVITGTGWSTMQPSVGSTGNVVFSKPTVPNGDTASFSVVVNVNPATAEGTVINDDAVAASTTPDPTSKNNTGSAATTVLGVADLAVTKTDTPDPVGAGNNITYTVNFVNNGPGEAHNVTVTDTVPANTTFVSAVVTTGTGWNVVTAPAPGGTGDVVFGKAIVAASESAVFTIVVNVNPGTAAGTIINNSAVVAGSTIDPTPGNDTGAATTTVQAVADLAVNQTDSPDPVIAGNNITYTVNFANNGPSIAANVTVTDAVPANTTFVSAVVSIGAGWGVTSPTVGNTGNIVFSKASVANAEAAVFTIVVKVNPNTPSGTSISNSATAATTSADPNPGNSTGTATTTVETQADLGINKTGMPSPVASGANLAYTIGVSNSGPSGASGVIVTDEIPPGTTFVSVTPSQGTFTAPPSGGTGAVNCSLGAIPFGGSASITLIVRVTAAAGATITNTAEVTSTSTDPVPGNNSSTVMTPVVFSPCSLNCPADVTANTLPLPFGCSALVSYPLPATIGPCAGLTCTPPPNSSFPVGVTPVICTADGGASCSFNVTVKDVTAPRITCSGNITTSAPSGQSSVVVKYSSPPVVVDNCSGGTAVCTPPSGSIFPVGTSQVTCTASDAAENVSTCTFSVTVTDSQAPTITCPSPVAVDVSASQCTSVVSYPPPTVTDNAPGTVATCVPPSGSIFPAGVTTVNCAAVDVSGNRSTCAFAVTVRRPGSIPQTTSVIFGGQTPVLPLRKAKKNPPASCDCSKVFTIPNNGCGMLGLNVSSISRTGSDVTSGKITNPDDSKFFSLRIINPDGSERPAQPDQCDDFCVQIAPGQSQTFRVVFSPVIPRPSGKTTGLAASEILPDTVTSRITFGTNSGSTLSVDLIGHVGTALQLINAAKPKKAATASFTKSGDEFVLTYSVFDSNLDTARAKYELLDQGGAVVGQAIEVDLIQPIIEGRVSKGQSFVVEQRFTGARNHPEITSIRITVFDAESNSSLTAQLGSSANSAGVGASSLARPVALKPRNVRLPVLRP